jgi:hypothetical protein
MCQNCNNNSCGGCNQQCYQFPPPPGPPGQVGPQGVQGPPGAAPPFNIVVPILSCPSGPCPYVCDGTEDVILIKSAAVNGNSTVDVYLLPSTDPLMQKRVVRVCDSTYLAATHDIRIIPDPADTVANGLPGVPLSLLVTVGVGGSVTLVTNNNNPALATGYNIV